MYAHAINWFTETPLRRVLGALVVVFSAALLLSAVTGCNLNVRKDEEAGRKDVEIRTPFGSLKARNDADPKDTGLAVYPSSQRKPATGDDKHSANVQISGLFGLKVAVVSYLSDDSTDKVLTWYRDEFKKMGRYVECSGEGDIRNIGVDHDSDDGDNKPVSCEKHRGGRDHRGRKYTELKFGTENNQKVVAVTSREDGKAGAEFVLIRIVVRGKDETI